MTSNLSPASASSLPARTERRHLSCAETAKLVRQCLKEAFPGIKISVRSSTYSMGTSIDVSWDDGPCEALVDPIVDRFRGAYFDGMEDCKGSRYAMMTTEAGLEQVSFGADFIRLSRHNSDQALVRAIGWVYRRYHQHFLDAQMEMPTVGEYRDGSLFNVRVPGIHGPYGGDTLQDSIRQASGKHTFVLKVEKSKTAGGIFVTHTDGRPHAPPVLKD